MAKKKTEQSKELVAYELMQAVGGQIDKIVDECVPMVLNQKPSFTETLVLAEGISNLRQIILHDEGIKKTVESMQDTKLGFITDRSPKAIETSKIKDGGKWEIKPYPYSVIAECLIEGMLNGYRMTGNEINIISGGFYAAKNGKYRMIVEHPEVTDFDFTTTSPMFSTETRFNKAQDVAKVQCFASWKQEGVLRSMGISSKDGGKEDKLIFTIPCWKSTGDDAILGKAISKLFSRVWLRINGKILPESTDVTEGALIPLDTSDTQDAETVDFDEVREMFNSMVAERGKGDLRDDEDFQQFISMSAKHFEKAEDEIRMEALEDIDGFMGSFEGWLKRKQKVTGEQPEKKSKESDTGGKAGTGPEGGGDSKDKKEIVPPGAAEKPDTGAGSENIPGGEDAGESGAVEDEADLFQSDEWQSLMEIRNRPPKHYLKTVKGRKPNNKAQCVQWVDEIEKKAQAEGK